MAGKPSMKNGEVFTSTNGPMVVLDYQNAKRVFIQFTKTGHTRYAEAADIRIGNVKDPLHPSVHGMGYIGVGSYKVSQHRIVQREYHYWNRMLRRCYDTKYHKLKPTYATCSVSPRWLNYQSFCEDLPKLPGFDLFQSGDPCHLDKDIRIPGNKIYSADSCCFVTPSENSIEMNKRYKNG